MEQAIACYVRVSTSKQADEGQSLDSQERAIRAYCTAHGLAAPVLYADAGVSGWKDAIAHRPAFARLLADAEAGAIDTIIVSAMDRWSRSLRVTLETLQRLDRAGVALISLREHIDYSSAVGKLTIAMMGAIGQFQSDDRSAGAKRVHAELRAQGKWDGGSPPYGARVGADGKLELDPAKADGLAHALALVATESYHVAADMLNAAGVPPPGIARRYRAGPPRGWWPTSLRNAVVGARWLLTQPDPWPARYLAATARPAVPPVARTRTIRTLTGLGRCHACGHAVVYSYSHARDDLRLRCETPGCKLRYGRADRHEAAIRAAVAALRPREHPATSPAPDFAAWSAIAEQRRRYATMFGALRIDEATYDAAIRDLDTRETALASVTAPPRELVGISAVLPHLALLPGVEQNTVLRQLIRRVTMHNKDERQIVWHPSTVVVFAGCD